MDTAGAATAAAPQEVGACAESVAAAATEGDLGRVIEACPFPVGVVDGERRYLHANPPARLALHLSLDELRALRIDDLTPEPMLEQLQPLWDRLLRAGVLTGTYEIVTPDGADWEVVYYAVSARVPDRYVIAFSPAGWPENELNLSAKEQVTPLASSATDLTDREREIVELLAHGLTGEEIAVRLHISRETTRTHIRNAMRRMGAKTRAHLVALAFGAPDSLTRR